jgi:hypothetical protein
VGVGAVRGQVPDTDLQALIRRGAQATTTLDVGPGALITRQLVESAARTFTSLSANPSDLRATIADAAAVLPHVTRTANSVDDTLTRLDPLLRRLIPQGPSITATLRTLRQAVTGADALLQDATPLLQKLHPTVDSLAQTARIGTSVISALTPSLTRLDKTILPGLDMTTPESGGRTVYESIGPVLVAFASLSAGYDRDGDFANLTLGAPNQNSAQLLPCATDFSKGTTDFLVCTSLSTTIATLFGGGVSLLQSLKRDPSLATQLGNVVTQAKNTLSSFNLSRSQLLAHAHKVANFLFSAHRGGGG